jgi:Predicted pPIWI-associating nuclease
MPDDALLQSLGHRLPDQFSHDLLNGALHVLGQADNKMRAHQFAATLRELIGQVLKIMAPTAKMAVDTSSWRDKPLQTTNLGVRSSNLFGRATRSTT